MYRLKIGFANNYLNVGTLFPGRCVRKQTCFNVRKKEIDEISGILFKF